MKADERPLAPGQPKHLSDVAVGQVGTEYDIGDNGNDAVQRRSAQLFHYD
jgi:hypothetical protein